MFLSSIESKRHQPKIKLASKHERQVDLRPFPERKSLFNGVSFLLRAISPSYLMRRHFRINNCWNRNDRRAGEGSEIIWGKIDDESTV
jgi:hypothetical protein